jgi:hypothetical protein
MKVSDEDQQKAREMVYDWEEVYKPPNLQLFGTRAGLIDRIATAITETRADQREVDAQQCDDVAKRYSGGTFNDSGREVRTAEECAAAIRAAAGDEK